MPSEQMTAFMLLRSCSGWAYRLTEPSLKMGYDLILVARTRTGEVSMNAVKEQLEQVLERMGVRIV